MVPAVDVEREQLVPFSAKTGEGRDELLGALSGLLGIGSAG